MCVCVHPPDQYSHRAWENRICIRGNIISGLGDNTASPVLITNSRSIQQEKFPIVLSSNWECNLFPWNPTSLPMSGRPQSKAARCSGVHATTVLWYRDSVCLRRCSTTVILYLESICVCEMEYPRNSRVGNEICARYTATAISLTPVRARANEYF